MNARDVETKTRSWLFTPATRPERFGKAGPAGADVLIVDLEDAVRPEEKTIARRQLGNLLSQPFSSTAALAVRINTPNSRNGLDDLAVLLDAEFQPAFIVIPKVEAAHTVLQVEALLREVASDARVVPLVESRKGVVVLPEVLATRLACRGGHVRRGGLCRGRRRAACVVRAFCRTRADFGRVRGERDTRHRRAMLRNRQ